MSSDGRKRHCCFNNVGAGPENDNNVGLKIAISLVLLLLLPCSRLKIEPSLFECFVMSKCVDSQGYDSGERFPGVWFSDTAPNEKMKNKKQPEGKLPILFPSPPSLTFRTQP